MMHLAMYLPLHRYRYISLTLDCSGMPSQFPGIGMHWLIFRSQWVSSGDCIESKIIAGTRNIGRWCDFCNTLAASTPTLSSSSIYRLAPLLAPCSSSGTWPFCNGMPRGRERSRQYTWPVCKIGLLFENECMYGCLCVCVSQDSSNIIVYQIIFIVRKQ